MSVVKILDKTLENTIAFPRNPGNGEVGIEIETEGRRLPNEIASYWRAIPDHSLRGEALEYILSKPINRGNVFEALTVLENTFRGNNTIINESYRTSVHVHLNARKSTFREIFNHICLYLIFEDILTEYCGRTRQGNVFCLRARDAEYLIDAIVTVARSGRIGNFGNDNLRYSAINLKALAEHGSLEFRAFRGTTAPDLINNWVQLLLNVKDAAYQFKNPAEIIQQFSLDGPQEFFQNIFGDNANLLNYSESSMFNGLRFAQEVAFAIPSWEPPPPKTIAGIGAEFGDGAGFAGGLPGPQVFHHVDGIVIGAGGGGGGAFGHAQARELDDRIRNAMDLARQLAEGHRQEVLAPHHIIDIGDALPDDDDDDDFDFNEEND